MTPKIRSVNVSIPKEVESEGQKVTTGIFKEPVEGRIMLRTLNLDGDAACPKCGSKMKRVGS